MRMDRVPPWRPADLAEASSHPTTALDLVLHQARRLHRAAQNGALLQAMPALRRAYTAGVLPGRSLGTLFRERQQLQRKHFLRTLAVEAGHPDWEHYRRALASMPPQALDDLKASDGWHGFLNHWFSTETEAQDHARRHGGTVHRIGMQAVVVEAGAKGHP
jgi:hypothetical protein